MGLALGPGPVFDIRGIVVHLVRTAASAAVVGAAVLAGSSFGCGPAPRGGKLCGADARLELVGYAAADAVRGELGAAAEVWGCVPCAR